jgi:hypothetical protein
VSRANEHLSYKDWVQFLEHLCVQRLRNSLTAMPGISNGDMEEAWRDGATPEEFFTTDVEILYSYPPLDRNGRDIK